MSLKQSSERGRSSLALSGMAVPADKCKQQERWDGDEEVRWVVVLMKRGNARGGKDPG